MVHGGFLPYGPLGEHRWQADCQGGKIERIQPHEQSVSQKVSTGCLIGDLERVQGQAGGGRCRFLLAD